jgi:signal transduction histidine kinase
MLMEKAQIVIVDDDPASQETLADLLQTELFHIKMVSDGMALFAFLTHSIPDVILLDVMMPHMDGYEVCRQLKENVKWQHIPVVLVTALSNRKSMLKGLEAGADDFLSKPVNGSELRVRVRNMARIKRQYDALQATIQLQEDLVRLAVHDMRSPLATIFLHTGTLLFKQPTESNKWSLDVIDLEAHRLNSFIDDLLLLIKRDKDNLRLSYSEVKLNKLVSNAIQASTLLANAAEVKIEVSLPAEDRAVSLDAGLFRRVVDNLLTNAIRHSPVGGKIAVTVSYSATAENAATHLSAIKGRQGVHLTISDEGPTIPPERREQIFEMVEIINFRNRGISGPGIGLAFCKLVVVEHGGTIFVTDNQPKGSVFVVDL